MPSQGRTHREADSGNRRWLGALVAATIAAVLACSGCAPPQAAPADQGPIAQATSPLLGQDGALDVQNPGTVLNQYAVLAADAAAGATAIDVTDVTQLDSPLLGPLAPEDLLLVIQMRGATIDATDTDTFGAVTDLGGAGLHEFIAVAAIVGNTIHVDSSGGGLRNSYSAAGRVQVVRVPQLASLIVDPGASITAPAWDGQRGGIVAVHVATSLALDGTIDVSGLGFRGGAVDNQSQAAGTNVTLYRSANAADGAEKGESIAGDATIYAALFNGAFGRGAPANGGGGGNSHNAGGGGGANGNSGQAWTGQGIMDPGAVGAAAWQLDPGYTANGNALTTSSGGGRGGYTYAANDQNAITVPPGNNGWGGNRRRERGGLGGRPLAGNASSRLFFGGGGGAGDGNNDAAGAGGPGGGMVYIITDSVTGAGAVHADGGAGQNTSPGHNDAPGGGGGGGTIVMHANALAGVTLTANGGSGGNQLITVVESEGPGGGGSGGFIATSGGVVTRTVAVGAYGTTTSTAVTEFPANGATGGALGQPDEIAGAISGLLPVDSDGDGLGDGVELYWGTDPNDADSDDDGVMDGQEPQWNVDSDGDGLINALDPDSDNDGLFDGTEMGFDCSNPATNIAAGHCIADADHGATTTNPLDPDTDHGGVPDGHEDLNHNGAIDGNETNPNDPVDDIPCTNDGD